MGSREAEVRIIISRIRAGGTAGAQVWFTTQTIDGEHVAETGEYGPYLAGEGMRLKLEVAVNPTLIIIEERGTIK